MIIKLDLINLPRASIFVVASILISYDFKMECIEQSENK